VIRKEALADISPRPPRAPDGAALPRVREAHTLAACALVAALAAGCGSPPAAPAAPPRTLPPPADLIALPAPPAWTTALAQPLTVSVAADGSVVAGSSPADGRGDVAWAFAASGVPVPLQTAAGGAVFALPGGLVVVGPGVADPPGPAELVDIQGLPLWTGAAVGPISAVGAMGGLRLAIVDSGTASVTELTSPAGGPAVAVAGQGLSGLAAGAAVQFDDQGDALVVDAVQASLDAPSGTQQWSVALTSSTLPRSLALDRDGAGVTVATTGTDNTLYQFAALPGGRPSVSWSEPLASGGPNLLVPGPRGRVAVLGVGGGATFAVYREQDGALLWQDTVPPAGSGPSPTVTGLAFLPQGGAAVALSGCGAGGAPCILEVDAHGAPLGRIPLPTGAQVTLAADAAAAAVLVPPAQSAGPSTLEWINLPARPAAPPAASGPS